MTFNKAQNSDIKVKIIYLGKTCKVVKGGRKFKFCVLTAAGDEKGRVGLGLGKAVEVMDAKEKAEKEARRNLVKIPLRDSRTIHHDVTGRYGAGKVAMRTAPAGTGVIAGGAARAILELLGVKDIVVKSIGSNNPHNVAKAVLEGLQRAIPPRAIAERRRLKVSDIVSQREGKAHNQQPVEATLEEQQA